MTKKDVIKEFTQLKGVGSAKAELLYSHGFNSLEKLKKASVEELVKIKGVTEKNAEDIKDQLEEKKPEVKGKAKAEEITEKKSKEKKEKEPEEEIEIVEEEEKYRVKKKPELKKEQKVQLAKRQQIKRRTPQFLREEWFRYKRIPKNWRKPDGITSKMRKNLKYRPSKVRVGFRGPKEVRGLHPSGFEEVIVYNPADLSTINPKTQAARIGGTVGTKKRMEITKRAEELEIRILNMKV